jgi:hypothetical protein
MEHTSTEQTGYTGDAGGEPEALGGYDEQGFAADPTLDPLVAGGPEKKKRTGVMVLIVVVGLAIGSLFSMHTLTKVTAASGRNTEIERTIDRFLKGGDPEENPGGNSDDLVRGHREVVGVLSDDYTKHQVSELVRDPFDVTSGAVAVGDLSGSDGDYARAVHRDDVERAVEQLELKSVIMGSRPLANINGRIVRLNQVIPVEGSRSGGIVRFRVASIAVDSVTVVAEDPQLEMRIEKVIKLKR